MEENIPSQSTSNTTTETNQKNESFPPEPIKPSKLWLKLTLSLIVILLVGGGLVFAGMERQKRQGSNQPTPTPEAIATPTPDPTVDWKTYKNEACNFEVKHPLEWQVEKDCVKGLGNELPVWYCLNSPDFRGYLGIPSNNIEQGTAITMSCDKGFEEKSVQTMVNECLEDKQKFPEEKYVCELFEGRYENFVEIRPNEYHLIGNKTRYTVIIEPSSQTTPSVVKQILSTFKFLDETEKVDTSDWQTYTNTTFNYILKYPDGFSIAREEKDKPAFKSLIDLRKTEPKTLIDITIRVDSKSYQEAYNDWEQTVRMYKGKITELRLSNFPAKIAEFITGAGNSDYNMQIIFEKDGLAFHIDGFFTNPAHESDLDDFDQIISTFKFLD